MAHRIDGRKLSRKTGPRMALFKNLTVSVLRYERVKTTEAKGKEIRRFVDKMIGLGKDGSLAARRRAIAWLPEHALVEKLFTDLAQRYPDRTSGFLRMVRIGRRVGDAAPMVQLELAPSAEEERAKRETAAEAEAPRRRLPFARTRTSVPASKKPRSREKASEK